MTPQALTELQESRTLTPTRKVDPETVRRLFVAEGRTVTATAATIGCSRQAVYDALSALGVTPGRKLTDEQATALCKAAQSAAREREAAQTARLDERAVLALGVPANAVAAATRRNRTTVLRVKATLFGKADN
jgi:hypothetical protein